MTDVLPARAHDDGACPPSPSVRATEATCLASPDQLAADPAPVDRQMLEKSAARGREGASPPGRRKQPWTGLSEMAAGADHLLGALEKGGSVGGEERVSVRTR